MTVLRAVVVDDEPLARDELAFLLSECDQVEVVGQAADAAAGLTLCDTLKPDLAFVDLRMPGPDGLAFADALAIRRPETQVVVVSAHDDGALRAFEAAVADYLLKPVRLERLRHTLDRVRASSAHRSMPTEPLRRLAVRRKGAYVVLDVNDVIYFEVRDELTWAVTLHDRFALDLTLTTLEQRVDQDRFFRNHRGYLVAVERIVSIEPTGTGTYDLILDHPDARRVPLARERARILRRRIPFAG
jgi:DNA-binding LytR/AlgR family response regulator